MAGNEDMCANESERLGILIGTVRSQAIQLVKIEKVLDKIDGKFDSLDIVKRPEHDLLILRVQALESDKVAENAVITMHRRMVAISIALVGLASGILFNFLRATYSAMS